MTYVVDANIFLRILTADDPEQTKRATEIVKRATEGQFKLFVSDVCLAEIAWTLDSYYGLERSDIAEKILALLNTDGIVFSNRRILIDTIVRYKENKVDFVDAYHAAIAAEDGGEIYSYDIRISTNSRI
jgi:predicted nucleic-acid-binding protein